MTTVFVATEETQVLGVYLTRAKAEACCDEWSASAVSKQNWFRYDGAWQRDVLHVEGENHLTQRITEETVNE